MKAASGLTSLIVKFAIFSLILASGVVHGRFSGRWADAAGRPDFAELLDAIPESIGGWSLVGEVEPEENVISILQCDGYLHRNYVNKKTGSHVGMAIVVGPSGPTAVHTPEICYSSQDFNISGKRSVAELEANTFWVTNLHRKNVHRSPFRVYYAWSDGEQWVASENPRIEFGGLPYLFKIQVASDIRAVDEARDPILDFLASFQNECWPLGRK